MLSALFKTMRPKQWVKNLVLFAALVFDHKLLEPLPLLYSVLGFGLLCLLSSTVYFINDLADIEKDRQHPKKRFRPLASGALRPPVAVGAVAVLLAFTLPAAFALNERFGVIAAVYLGVNLLYSFYLKHVVLVDVLVVALGYLLRVGAGAAIIEVTISPWLYICMTLLALFMGFGKRRGELLTLKANDTRKVLSEYSLPFLDELINLVATSTLMAYSLYTFSAPNLPPNNAMMLTIPLVMYGVFRYLYLIHLKGEGGAPDELVLKDGHLRLTFVLWGALAVGILYFSPPS